MIRNSFSENRIRVATPRVDPGNVMDYTGISKGLSASMRAQCRSACACARTARALADKMRAHNPWGLSKTSRDHPSMRAQRALRAQGISRRGLPVKEGTPVGGGALLAGVGAARRGEDGPASAAIGISGDVNKKSRGKKQPLQQHQSQQHVMSGRESPWAAPMRH